MKYVFLDQCKWIELAKAYHGRRDGIHRRETLDACIRAVQQGTAAFPLSASHIMEMGKAKNPDKRKRLAQFVAFLSQGRSMMSSVPHVPRLLARRLISAFGDCAAMPPPPPVFGRGIDFAFGDLNLIEKEIDYISASAQSIRDRLNEQDAIEYVLSEPGEFGLSPEAIRLREQEAKLASHALKMRNEICKYGRVARRTSYALSVLAQLGNEIDAVFRYMELSPALLFEDPKLLLCLIDRIAPLHVEVELVTERDFQFSRPPAGNDMIDIGSLQMAIPYCDIVVTENFWTDLSHRLKFEQIYECRVRSKVESLIELLN